MKLAILRETKNPPDRRVPITPLQCRELLDRFPNLSITVQPGNNRCFSDHEFQLLGIPINEDISDCDLLMGVKEVKIEYLVPGKKYMFFSHTAKKQKHNLELLRAFIWKKIQMIDYEYLTDENKIRLVAFGHWAGFVGAYNALRAYGLRYNTFSLQPAWMCKDSNELRSHLSGISINKQKIVITGGGRVAKGAMEILDTAGFVKVNPKDFLNMEGKNIYTQLDPEYYVKPRGNVKFELNHFFTNPWEYENSFLPYTQSADIFIACHFWDQQAPVLMTPEDIRKPGFRIKIIADISCDINGPIPSTLRASTIAEPFYGYNIQTGEETLATDPKSITVMSVDNLPGELPRDASEDFGMKLVTTVIPALLEDENQGVIQRASITKNGKLTSNFIYLKDFLEGK